MNFGKRFLCCCLCLILLISLPQQYAIAVGAEEPDAVEPAIGIGYGFYAALSAEGTVYAWGWNTKGQLGIATEELDYSEYPRRIEASVKFKAIAVGREHILALDTDGTVWSWGANERGQLGHDEYRPGNKTEPTFIRFPADTAEIVEIAVSEQTSYALTADGKLFAWGSNDNGRLGIYSQDAHVEYVTEPELNPHLPRVSHIIASEQTVSAIASDGRLWMWGLTDHGQAGSAEVSTLFLPTCKSPSVEYRALDVASGDTHTSFLRSDGEIISFGQNTNGQFGNGERAQEDMILALTSLATFSEEVTVTSIAAGRRHMLALTEDGRLFTWGNNDVHQLGRDGAGDCTTPTELILNEEDTVRFITANYNVSAAIDSEGHVYLFGTEDSMLPTIVPGENGRGSLYLGLSEQEISREVYVTANATIPAPTFALIVPASLDFGTLEQKSPTAEDKIVTRPLTVEVRDVAYLFGKQITVTVVPLSGDSFLLIGNESSLAYSVYHTANGGTPLPVGDTFATFEDDGTVSGRIEIDQSEIAEADSYTGTLVFHVSTAEKTEE